MKLALLFCLPSAMATTIYFAGDSTMAHGGTGSGTAGWADYIVPYTSADVSNKAIAGRSARSYTREGHFDEIAAALNEGDYVVMEFGHNDGGSLADDNGRTDCPGSGNETCQTVYNGQPETVLTFPAYLQNAANMFLDKGASVLISSQTPNNPWETGTFSYTPSRFVGYAELAASRVGVDYVDHGAYVASIFKVLGEEAVDGFFPLDHTHTSPEGAAVVAEAFLKAVVCKGVALENVLTTTDYDGECL